MKTSNNLRENVVSAIYRTFLYGNSVFHPNKGRYETQKATKFITNENVCNCSFTTETTFSGADKNNKGIRFNSAELKEAVKLLLEDGYHIFKVKKLGYWDGFICSQNVFYNKDIVNHIELPSDFDK